MLRLTRLAVATRPGLPAEQLDAVLAAARAPRARQLLRDRAAADLVARASRPARGRRGRLRRAAPAVAELIRRRRSLCPSLRLHWLELEPNRPSTPDRGARPGKARARRGHPRHAARLFVHGLLRRVHGRKPAPDEGDLGRGAQRAESEHGLLPRSVEGGTEATWIVGDYIDVVAARLHPRGARVLPARGSVGRRAARDARSSLGLNGPVF